MSEPKRILNRDFLLLYQGQLVSQLGNQAFVIAMMFWLKQATGSATLMGTIMMVSTIPRVILSPFGGTLADRFSRRRIIITCDIANGLAVLGLAGVMRLTPDNEVLIASALIVVGAISGVVGAFFMPAVKAAIPSIVPADRVEAANSLDEGSTDVAALIGQGVGGILFRVLGAPVLFLIDGVTYLLSALSESFARIPQEIPARAETWSTEFGIFKNDLTEGLRYVWRRTGMRNFMIGAAVISFFATPFFVLLPFYVEDYLLATPDWYGFILAGFAGGGIVGYAIAASVRLRGRLRTTVVLSLLVALSLCMGALGFVERPLLALLVMTIAGIGHGIFHINLMTMFQLSTEADMRGRVMGVLQMAVMGMSPIAMGLTGVIADAMNQNAPLVYIVCGGVLLLASLLLANSSSVRDFIAQDKNAT